MKYTVRERYINNRQKFVLTVNGVEHEPPFDTAKLAKAHCWHTYNVVPVCVSGDEIELNLSNPVHAALRRIEARHSGITEIVGVGSQWYLVRKSRFGADFIVNYWITAGVVHARNDFEHTQQGEMA